MSDHDSHEDFGGLAADLPRILDRRRALGLFGGVSLAGALAACGASGSGSDTSTSPPGQPQGTPPNGGAPGATAEVGAGEIPAETGGPYPGDGSNGPNVLAQSGVVRSDIRSSFGDASGVADGVPLTFELTVVDVSSADQVGKAYAGAAVYVWHCDRVGDYSMYTGDAQDENYLRGVQEADAEGIVRFTSVFPGCYSGRWPHVHFEVYPTLADATAAQNRLRTSQLAFPEDACRDVYATTGYEQSVRNLEQTSLDSDMVFSDGYSLQLAKMSGSVSAGYQARLRVPV